MENNFDIFNIGIDAYQEEAKPASKSSEFKTDPKLSKDSIYRAIVRFVPNIKNPKKSIVKKFSYWLELHEGEGFYVDCPSSINEKSVVGFMAFMMMILFAIADIVTGFMNKTLVVNEFIFNSFLILVLGSFAIGSIAI